MQVETWEAVLVGIFVLILLLWFGPGVKDAVRNAPKGTSQDWKGLLFPIGLVVLFVALLLLMVSG